MAISKKKLEANRKNAQKSTGPKDTVVTRLNAMKHGILSRDILIKGENKKNLEKLGKKLRIELAPQGELENILVDRIVSSTWRLKRVIRVERNYIQSEYDDCKWDDWNKKERLENEAWNLVVTRELGNSNTWFNLLRYETAIEKQVYKALHELIRIQSARKGNKPPIPIAVDVDVSDNS